MKMERIKRELVTLVIVIFVAPIIFETVSTKISNNTNISSEDKLTAEKISNITGEAAEKIEKLKGGSKDWNEVLDKLKVKSGKQNSLTDTKLQENFDDIVKDLLKQGYSNETIMEAKLMAERVETELEDINQQYEAQLNAAAADENNKEDEVQPFLELQKKYKPEDALIFLLKLKTFFDTREKVLDEYLYSLQIDIDLNLYMKDKNEYEKEKSDKSSQIDTNKIINLEKIEEKQLELIQKQNKNTKSEVESNKNNTSEGNATSISSDKDSPLPETTINHNSPSENQVIDEINNINKDVLNQDGR